MFESRRGHQFLFTEHSDPTPDQYNRKLKAGRLVGASRLTPCRLPAKHSLRSSVRSGNDPVRLHKRIAVAAFGALGYDAVRRVPDLLLMRHHTPDSRQHRGFGNLLLREQVRLLLERPAAQSLELLTRQRRLHGR